MAEDEKFLSRWSRLKQEAAGVAPGTAAAGVPVPAELPSVDSLGFDSDFTGFLQAKVDGKLKQAALKKLFHLPHFNQMDGLDVYIDDYNTFEPIPESMLRELNHAQDLLFGNPTGDAADEPAVGTANVSGSEGGGNIPVEPAAPAIEVQAGIGAAVPLPEVPAAPSEADNRS
ncbi:MAG TPA: DUF3306 domain-containing protein [Rhodocyclaceae bacterium]|nr:DUF3306 domain-containing protein [Rhodocyclaceae bacterium]HMZ85015.1 DUF3306 domain-containing protein [Rhodocyclaceae bacterium]HNB78965.1 DUF3306 domain-containing protein [Rhodocyclaceae bacterium]HNH14737.1 DUF3306 domain-containing protein [Rhodocyclaceae bacterium]HNI00506.1 DUF3306 domain-containing protein [Rhodocyclaceae bacterium]